VTFAETIQQQYQSVDVTVMEDVDDAIANADVIVTATNATQPVFNKSLEAGVHVNAVGSFKSDMQELPSHAIANADKVVVEASEAALEETGDLITPIKEGLFGEKDLYGELGEIVSSHLAGRESDDEITVFKSVGVAIVDIIVANYFYQKAQKNNDVQ